MAKLLQKAPPSTGAPKAANPVLVTIMESKNRYKSWFHKALTILLGSCALNIILVVSLIVVLNVKAPPKIFAVTNDLRVMELPSLDQEHLTDAQLTQWAMETVPQVLSLDFDTWRQTLYTAQDKFSPEGLQRFVTLLQTKGWLDLIKDQRLLIHCGVTSPPAITSRGLKDGRKYWELEMPILISIEATQGSLKNNAWTMRLIMERCETRQNPRGVWIKVMQIF